MDKNLILVGYAAAQIVTNDPFCYVRSHNIPASEWNLSFRTSPPRYVHRISQLLSFDKKPSTSVINSKVPLSICLVRESKSPKSGLFTKM